MLSFNFFLLFHLRELHRSRGLKRGRSRRAGQSLGSVPSSGHVHFHFASGNLQLFSLAARFCVCGTFAAFTVKIRCKML